MRIAWRLEPQWTKSRLPAAVGPIKFSVTLVRGGDTIRCMVSVDLEGKADERSDGEKYGAALSRAKALAKALDSAIESA